MATFSGTWITPFHHDSPSLSQVGDGMLIFGGETSDGSLVNTLWRFDFGEYGPTAFC